MKKLTLAACLLAAATIAGTATAMSPAARAGFSLGLGAQYWEPEDIDDLDEDGFWGANIIARLRPVNCLGIDFRVGGTGVWDGDTYYVGGRKYKTDVSFMCYPVEVGLVALLPLGDVLTLYGGGGGGYYYYDIDIETTSRHGHRYWSDHIELEDDFGWYALGGLNIQVAPHLSIFGEVRYTETETSLKHDESVTFDASGIGFQAGIMVDF